MLDMDFNERRFVVCGLAAVTLSLAGWTGASVWLALQHMASLDEICGFATIHCGWCLSALLGAATMTGTAWTGFRMVADDPAAFTAVAES